MFDIGKQIRKLRKTRNMKQYEIGELVGVSTQTVSSWEVNRTEPSIYYLWKMADYFNVPLEYFVKEEG